MAQNPYIPYVTQILMFTLQITQGVVPRHENKLLSPSKVNAPGLPSNLLWKVGLVAHGFYQTIGEFKGISLENFPNLSKSKSHVGLTVLYTF